MNRELLAVFNYEEDCVCMKIVSYTFIFNTFKTQPMWSTKSAFKSKLKWNSCGRLYFHLLLPLWNSAYATRLEQFFWLPEEVTVTSGHRFTFRIILWNKRALFRLCYSIREACLHLHIVFLENWWPWTFLSSDRFQILLVSTFKAVTIIDHSQGHGSFK